MNPTKFVDGAPTCDGDEVTVAASNQSPREQPHLTGMRPSYAVAARSLFGHPLQECLSAITIASTKAIADMGATSIFIMEGTKVINKRHASKPLSINMPDGRKMKSTHICDITIPGLPYVLTGHIVPHLTVASLMGIRPLCNAGCTVTFDHNKCDVSYNENVLLQGYKDESTDLWTLPIIGISTSRTALPQSAPGVDCALHTLRPSIYPSINLANFTHSVKTRANGVKFAHQSLCNPKNLTLLKAVRKGFLKGCPNLSGKLILKYLNPSPATAKGHMKQPRQGIKSTRPKLKLPLTSHPSTGHVPPPEMIDNPGPGYIPGCTIPAFIADDCDEMVANVLCFGTFNDKHSGVLYNNLMGNFPFMSYDGSVCYLVLYHYKSNAIMATPITGLDNVCIFNAYKLNFKELKSKGYKPILNVMDNQATKYIKKFLTKEECKLQLVEPHNHRVIAAEQAIQTFKDAFIAALATTDRNFPLQLWDKLMTQVVNTLNMMHASRIDPTISANEILHGPYDWNRYPLAPLGCKAVVYEDGDMRGSWASRGVDGWYLGPSMDHYRCDIYYIPETRAYQISGSTELFPQHCQLPDMTPHQHLRALTDELTDGATETTHTPKGKRLL